MKNLNMVGTIASEDENTINYFSQNLKYLREKQGYSEKDLALKLKGFTEDMVKMLEKGDLELVVSQYLDLQTVIIGYSIYEWINIDLKQRESKVLK